MSNDISKFRLPTTAVEVASSKNIVAIPIRKPLKDEWVTLQRESGWSEGPIAMIRSKEKAKEYLVLPQFVSAIPSNLYDIVHLYGAITSGGVPFLWPVKVNADTSGTWNKSMQEAIVLASTGWVRVAANMAASQYDVFTPVGALAEAVWPLGLTFERMFEIATKDCVVDSDQHPVLRHIAGNF